MMKSRLPVQPVPFDALIDAPTRSSIFPALHVSVLAIGRKMPAWVEQASTDYIKRLPRRWQFAVREFAQARGSNSELTMAQEAEALLAATPEKSHVVALDNRGSCWSTEQVKDQLQKWQFSGKNVVFLIGGPQGLHPACTSRADQLWSLSPLTFPHPLVRVILTEQLYRAQSLIDNHPYHRA